MTHEMPGLLFHWGTEGNCLHAPWSFAFVPSKYSAVEVYNFLIRALYQGENALVPLPLQKRSI